MKRRLRISAILLALALQVAALGYFAGVAHGENSSEEDSAYSNLAVFTKALQLIRQDYVDTGKVSYRELIYAALQGMLSSLDPHSQFMEPSEFDNMQADTRSEFGGLGIVVSVRDDMLTVVSPIEGTPGFKAGLLPGDRIIKINGTSTEKMELSHAISRLRGEPGTSVTITILRPSNNEIKDFTLVRENIPVESVKGGKLLDPEMAGGKKIGYIRIQQFSEPTAEDLSRKLDQLEEQGMEALVLDLRFNPGGLLTSAVDVAAEFLDPRQLVVYTEGQVPSQKRPYHTDSNYEPREKFPLAILIHSGSASGAEIVAGALKDLNRAVLVGETTFGKGSVQSVAGLPDGSALRLTTAKYYTPSRNVIHEKGITPHIRVTLTPQQERDLNRLRRAEYLSEEDQARLDQLRDVQLERAVDALRGILIYEEEMREEPAP